MSSSLGASKISEVLQILSEQSDDFDDHGNACAATDPCDDGEASKQIFTDAVNYCMLLLSKTDRLTNHRSEVLSDEATLMGHEMFERIISVDVQMDVETEDEVLSDDHQRRVKDEPRDYFDDFDNVRIHAYSLATEERTSMTSPPSSPSSAVPTNKNTANSSTLSPDRSSHLDPKRVEKHRARTIKDFFSPFNGSSTKTYASDFDEKQLPPSPVSLHDGDDTGDNAEQRKFGTAPAVHRYGIPLEVKMKVIALARAHPHWSLKRLQEKGSPYLRTMDQLKQWEKQVGNGGTPRDKFWRINERTYERFAVARANSQRVTGEILRKWSVQVARELYGTSFKFDGSHHWLSNFKRAYGLQHDRNTSGYLTKDESLTNGTAEELRSLVESKRRGKKYR